MKINIDISVIIPAFNAADSIGALVHTLLGETTLSAEIIVVNDGSTDETWTVLSAITDERLILIRQKIRVCMLPVMLHWRFTVVNGWCSRMRMTGLRQSFCRNGCAQPAKHRPMSSFSMPGIQTAPDICGIPFTTDSLTVRR